MSFDQLHHYFSYVTFTYLMSFFFFLLMQYDTWSSGLLVEPYTYLAHSLFCCRSSYVLSYCSAYRALYILNWIYRYLTEEHYVHWISTTLSFSHTSSSVVKPTDLQLLWGLMSTSKLCHGFAFVAWIAGLIQTLLYTDFFYYYNCLHFYGKFLLEMFTIVYIFTWLCKQLFTFTGRRDFGKENENEKHWIVW